MTIREDLIKAVEQAPDSLVEEVFNFLLFTKMRYQQKNTESLKPVETTAVTEAYSSNAGESLLEMIERITADMTPEEIAQLPTDGAEQHDHYIYGVPKRQP